MSAKLHRFEPIPTWLYHSLVSFAQRREDIVTITSRRLQFIQDQQIETLPELQRLTPAERFDMRVVAKVLPFRANNYLVEELIDWNNIPNDPIFRLNFPHKSMLSESHFERMKLAVLTNDLTRIREAASLIQSDLNPHPAGQKTANVPQLNEEPVEGVQHKYQDTCLIFPSNGQTCQAYCTYCFRWPQFVENSRHKFATDSTQRHLDYLRQHTEITDVLFTGGDPMIMGIGNLARYIEPLLQPEYDHIQTIRIGTKSVANWPHRYVTDKDADDVLRLFAKVVDHGKQLALMGHYSHPRELETEVSQTAIRRIRTTGAVIRTQAPLVRNVNDNAETWLRMWQLQTKLGCVPYYMFIARDTGASPYFAVTLAEAYYIYQSAYSELPGLSRTVRGPSMSAHPGKVSIEGIAEIMGERVFILNFLRARKKHWVKRPFFAKFDPDATWFDQLTPAFGETKFPFEHEEDYYPLTDGQLTQVPENISVNELTNSFSVSPY